MTNNEPHDDNTQSFVPLTPGVEVGHYRIIEKIGAGGMGEVYLAEDTKLKRNAALKFMPLQYMNDSGMRERFTREARAVAALSHPNIVTIFEVGEFNNRPFFAMEHVKGESLKDVIKKGKLTTNEAINYAMQICEGLQEAHEAGITHRDIKPGNIIINTKGRARLLDFGLAMVAGEDKLTKTGSTLGTIGYMSPEQIEGTKVDHRSDIFSVGVILYEMVTGRRPFEGDNDVAVVKAITSFSPEPMARFKSGLPDGLQALIDKSLEKDVKTRYQHADGICSELMRVKRSLESTGTSASNLPSRKKSFRMGLIAASLAVIAAIVILIFTKPWEDHATGAKTERIRLVVLPFENLGDPEDEYFADGITDEITSRLAKLSALGVISRGSAVLYKKTDKDPKQIAEELDVDFILEGTIRWDKSGASDRVRITPQLIKVSDNTHLWAENYEREISAIFDVQSSIATSIAEILGVTLLKPERELLNPIPTNNLDAYDKYLQGKALLLSSSSRVFLDSAIKLFHDAIEFDPNFANAYARLSEVHSALYFFYNDMHHPHLAKEALDKALSINPRLPDAHIALGFYYTAYLLDHERALEELRLAEQLDPNSGDLHWMYSFVFKRQGRWDEALSHSLQALEMNPRDPARFNDVADIYIRLRNYSQAEKFLKQTLSIDVENQKNRNNYMLAELLWGGGVEGSREVMYDAPAGTEPDELMVIASAFADEILGLWRYGLISPNSVNIKYLLSLPRENFRPHVYWTSMGQAYAFIGYPDTAAYYYDSAAGYLEEHLRDFPDDFHARAELGLTYSMLGRHDEAIEQALRANEILPLSSCYW